MKTTNANAVEAAAKHNIMPKWLPMKELIDEACYAFIPVFPFLGAEEVKTQAQRTRIKNQTTHDQGQRTEEK